jgi:anti-sigma regulatory factor (Ser/Thr protein kinase)
MHGYRDMSGTVHVRGRCAHRSLSISIRDFGRGMQPRPLDARRTGMGLGLALIGRLVSELSVSPQAGNGTDVRMRFDLVPATVPARPRAVVA